MRRPPAGPRWAGSPPTRRARSCAHSPGRHSSVPTSWKSRHPTTAPARSPPCSRPTSSSRSSVSWRSGNDRCSGAREAGSSRGWPDKGARGSSPAVSCAAVPLAPVGWWCAGAHREDRYRGRDQPRHATPRRARARPRAERRLGEEGGAPGRLNHRARGGEAQGRGPRGRLPPGPPRQDRRARRQDATGGRDARDARRPGDADRDRLPRPGPQRHHRPERRLRADDARDARPLLRALQPGRGPARSHRRDLADPRVLCLPEPADQLRGAPPDPVRDRPAGCRDQDREPRHSRDRGYRLDGARLAHAVRRPRDRPACVVVGDRAHGRRDGRALPVRRRGRGAGARAPPAPRPERPRGSAGDGQGAVGSGGAGPGVRRDLARGGRGGAGRGRRAREGGRGERAHAESRQGRHEGRSPMISVDSLLILVVVFAVIFFIGSFAKILREYERAVIFRLGRSTRAIFNPGGQGSGPGLVLLVPLIDKMVKVSLQTVALDVAPQDVITRDNVSLKVSAVIYFRVVDPERAVIAVQDYLYATSQIAQTTLRSVLGQVELDDLLSARDKINQQLQRIIDEHTEPWGIKVATVEVKQIDLPQDMQRAMAKQAEAERERRAKVINADGEFQAA